ncbi:hypothetical protein [Pseudoduganella buxea]|uniref:Imelysin-like domain-containing protein n=1 Tax=Pseudoduganella buxea TaxID=1949069 RepID=A0A6I3STW5_9BURK|nr:hypothetical protein [Pseudoduganella buxea]MTV52578.1 hypothetical protein [Pseudoduganella buxea]GGB87341.1 hypothetical protein GCM10011572_06730 [Pseudoduganella buxea]
MWLALMPLSRTLQMAAPVLALLLAGCAATPASRSGFTQALAEPAAAAGEARLLARQAADDAEKLYVLGAGPYQIIDFGRKVCVPVSGPAAADAALGVFGDALALVQQVGATPDDVGYAGYIAQLRLNAANRREADLPAAGTGTTAAQQRCRELFSADAAGVVGQYQPGVGPAALPGIAPMLALDDLARSILAVLEATSRDEAVTETVKRLVPKLEQAEAVLRQAPGSSFGPYIQHAPASAPAACAMNQTTLGAMVTLRRWMVAQTLLAQQRALKNCRWPDCLGTADGRRNVDDLVANMRLYRGLAALDTAQTLALLHAGVTQAREVADGKRTPAQLLDALVAIADAVSTVSDKRDAWRAARP